MNLYDTSIPLCIHQLKTLSNYLKKGEDHADAKGISHEELMNASLYPDMKPLPFQIWVATNAAKFIPVRLGGAENVVMEDNQVTFADLQDRIKKTIKLLEGVDRASFDNAEEKEIPIKYPKYPGVELNFNGLSYLNEYAIPNFLFHVTTAYAILRHKGVEIGKRDFLVA